MEARGCEKKTKQAVSEEMVEGGSIPLFRCPRTFLSKKIIWFGNLFSFAQQGHLPVKGGVLEQSHRFLISYNYLSSCLRWIEDGKGRKKSNIRNIRSKRLGRVGNSRPRKGHSK